MTYHIFDSIFVYIITLSQATIKKCVDDYCVTLKEINAKNTLNTVYGVSGINGFSVTPCSGVSESVDSPDVDRL